MTWLEDHWLDILGWGGSALLVYSLLQSRVLRFRVLNLAACLLLVVFNALIEVWPMVGMNVVLSLINIYFIAKLTRDRHDDAVFEVLEVGATDQYLRHVLRIHGTDIARFNPGFEHDAKSPGQQAYIVQKGDEMVGVVIVSIAGETAQIRLDYVTPKYRDFSPGEFVWRRSGMLAGRGIRRVISPPGMVGAYYDRVGFQRHGDTWQLEVAA